MIPVAIALREGLRLARKMGVSVQQVRRTGEIRLRHRSQPKPVVVNARRKTASRKVVAFLRRVARSQSPNQTGSNERHS